MPARLNAPLALLSAALLAACSGPFVRELRVEPPVLPAALVEPIPARVGVHFSPAFRDARPESAYTLFGDQYVWRHVLGDASVDTFRRVLASAFSEVVELERWPSPEADAAGLTAVLVPGEPSAWVALSTSSIVWPYRQGFEYPLVVYSPAGERLAQWSVLGEAGTGVHGPLFVRQGYFDQATLRNAAASLTLFLQHEAVLAALRPAPAEARTGGVALPATSGTVTLRLDAGLARDDGIERRIAACLEPQTARPSGLGEGQPAAALRDALFPWFEPGVMPQDTEGIAALLERPRVREALTRLGVAHLVLFTAREGAISKTDSFTCVGGFGAGACFGLLQEKNSYVIELAVWDVAARRPVGRAQSRVERRVGVVGVLLPIPFFSSNETEACARMRNEVHEAIVAAP